MPRPPRIHVNGALYYVAQEAEQGKQLFKDREDCNIYLNLLQEYKEKYSFKLHSFCLLPNNIHLVLEPGEHGTISNIMRDLTSRYTKHFNGRYETLGSLFHSRFKAVVVEKDGYLLSSLVNFLGTMTERLEMVHLENSVSYPSNQACVTNGNTPSVNMKNLIDSESSEIWNRFAQNPMEPKAQNAMIAHLENGLKRSVLGSPEFVARIKQDSNQISQETLQKHVENADVFQKHSSSGVFANYFSRVILSAFLAAMIPMVSVNLHPVSKQKAENTQSANEISVYKPEVSKVKKELVVVLNGTRWNVQLMPIDGNQNKSVEFDHLEFSENQVMAESLRERGFDPTHYTMSVTHDGVIIWETIQRNKVGEIISWRGEWNGEKMTGILSKQLPGGRTQNFNFVGAMQSATHVGQF